MTPDLFASASELAAHAADVEPAKLWLLQQHLVAVGQRTAVVQFAVVRRPHVCRQILSDAIHQAGLGIRANGSSNSFTRSPGICSKWRRLPVTTPNPSCNAVAAIS